MVHVGIRQVLSWVVDALFEYVMEKVDRDFPKDLLALLTSILTLNAEWLVVITRDLNGKMQNLKLSRNSFVFCCTNLYLNCNKLESLA